VLVIIISIFYGRFTEYYTVGMGDFCSTEILGK
jgi:hypothetical protein